MASVFKRGGRKNRTGRYIASYFNENGGRITRSTGTSDKDVAEQIAAAGLRSGWRTTHG
jgi:hypothetical protein